MRDLNKIYDRKFFEEWGRNNKDYVDMSRRITDFLYEMLKPRSLIDLGCGCGVYSHFFKERGVKVLALDGVNPPKEESFPLPMIIEDLTRPIFNKWGAFDVTLCLEVAEHIPEKYLDPFLKNLTRFSETLVLSAAPPHQGGHYHVNEQPKRYWVQKLAREGFVYNRPLTLTGRFVEWIKTLKLPLLWMGEHVSFYEKSNNKREMKQDFPFGTRIGTS